MGIAKIVKNKESLDWNRQHSIEVSDALMCCGLRELNGIQSNSNPDPFTILCGIVERYTEGGDQVGDFLKASAVIFTQSNKEGLKPMGDKLAAYIKAQGLGPVVATKGRVNKGSGNIVKTFVWEPNAKAEKLFEHIEDLLQQDD